MGSKSEKTSVIQVVVLTIITLLVTLLVVWLTVFSIFRGKLKSAASDYFSSVINAEYVEKEKLGIEITEENSEEICRKTTELDDIRSSALEKYDIEIEAEDFISFIDYLKTSIIEDKAKLQSLKEQIEECGGADTLDAKNVDLALKSLDDISVDYATIKAVEYMNNIEIVCCLMSSYEAIDDLLENCNDNTESFVDYKVDTSVLELRSSVNNVVSNSDKASAILEYCDKIANVIKCYGNLVIIAEGAGQVVGDSTSGHEFTVLEYLLALDYDTIDLGVNIMAESNGTEETYTKLQAECLDMQENKFLEMFGLFDMDAVVQNVVSSQFLGGIKPIEMAVDMKQKSLFVDNLKDIFQVSLIYGGIFENIETEAGLTLADSRLGLLLNTTIRGLGDLDFTDEDIANIRLWTKANQILLADVYDKAENLEDGELKTAYEALFGAITLNMDNINYTLELY